MIHGKNQRENHYHQKKRYYGEVNNKYMHDYDKKESTYIQYLDFNNQCGWALSQPLPYGGFDYVEDISINS